MAADEMVTRAFYEQKRAELISYFKDMCHDFKRTGYLAGLKAAREACETLTDGAYSPGCIHGASECLCAIDELIQKADS